MQDLLGLPNQPSLFSSSCNVASGKFSPYVHEQEANFVTKPCDNPNRENIITCKDRYLNEFIDEVNGLELDLTLESRFENIPFYIPVLDQKVNQIPNLSKQFPIVGLTLNDILNAIKYEAGVICEERNITFRPLIAQAPCFKNTKIILFSTGPDTLIEYVWSKRSSCDFYNKIQQMGFYAIGGFNFSLIRGECAFSQVLNMKRSLYSSYLYEKNGIASIPHIYALTKYHVERWVKWLNENKSVNFVTVNCQLQKSKEVIEHLIQWVGIILAEVPRLHVILQGFNVKYLDRFSNYISRIHLAEKQPLKIAQSNQRMIFDENHMSIAIKYDNSSPIPELIHNNFEVRRYYLEKRLNIETSIYRTSTKSLPLVA